MKLSQKQSVTAIVITSIILFLFLATFTKFFNSSHSNPRFFTKIQPDMYLEKITYYLNKHDLRCKIKAKNARWFQKKGILILKDINATITKDSSLPIYISALKGFLDTKKSILTLKNKVTLKRGTTIVHTSLLFYNSKKNLIFTNKPVKIMSQGLSLKGVGMTYSLKTGELVIKNQRSIINQTIR